MIACSSAQYKQSKIFGSTAAHAFFSATDYPGSEAWRCMSTFFNFIYRFAIGLKPPGSPAPSPRREPKRKET